MLKRDTHSHTIMYTPAIPTKMYKVVASHVMPKVIQATKLKPKIPIVSQLSAPTIVKISAMTEKTLKVFFNLFSSLLVVLVVWHSCGGIYVVAQAAKKELGEPTPFVV